jgi:hypothetical protein
LFLRCWIYNSATSSKKNRNFWRSRKRDSIASEFGARKCSTRRVVLSSIPARGCLQLVQHP